MTQSVRPRYSLVVTDPLDQVVLEIKEPSHVSSDSLSEEMGSCTQSENSSQPSSRRSSMSTSSQVSQLNEVVLEINAPRLVSRGPSSEKMGPGSQTEKSSSQPSSRKSSMSAASSHVSLNEMGEDPFSPTGFSYPRRRKRVSWNESSLSETTLKSDAIGKRNIDPSVHSGRETSSRRSHEPSCLSILCCKCVFCPDDPNEADLRTETHLKTGDKFMVDVDLDDELLDD